MNTVDTAISDTQPDYIMLFNGTVTRPGDVSDSPRTYRNLQNGEKMRIPFHQF